MFTDIYKTDKKYSVIYADPPWFFKTYSVKGKMFGAERHYPTMQKEEIQNEERRNNTLNTLHTLLKLGIVPIINANDTISTYEIEFSDNDNLSAMVAEMIEADLLILLTDIDGLDLEIVSKILPKHTKFNPGILTHIHLHSKFLKQYSSTKKKSINQKMTK